LGEKDVALFFQQAPKGPSRQEIAALLPLALKNARHARMHKVENKDEIRNLEHQLGVALLG